MLTMVQASTSYSKKRIPFCSYLCKYGLPMRETGDEVESKVAVTLCGDGLQTHVTIPV